MCDYMREALEASPSPELDRYPTDQLVDELRAFTFALVKPDALALYRLIVAEGWRFPDLARVFDQSGPRVIRQRVAALLESGGLPSTTSMNVAGAVGAVAVGDAYQRAVLGIVDEGDGEAFARQIRSAAAHGLQQLARS